MISVQIAKPLEKSQPVLTELQALLVQTAAATLSEASHAVDEEATLVITNDRQVQRLNRTYLDIDAPTDVLSFPSGEIDPETGATYLGDVIISYPRAAAQAAAGGHPIEAELQLLVVHGMLHLCGYDHGEADEKAAMWKMQALVLDKLGCSILGPPAERDG
jgi:probable rRNA maturation factor